MLKLLTIFSVFILLTASTEPEDLTLGEPESLSLNTSVLENGQALPGIEVDVEIQSIPPGAMVYIDGKRLGITPISCAAILSGEHYLTIKKRGYFTYEKDLSFSAEEKVAIILPLLETPEGYLESLRKTQSRAGVILELEMGAFRRWLHSSERYADDLAEIAGSCLRLADALEYEGLNHDALRCRNAACGFYTLLELAAGTDFLDGTVEDSLRIAKGIRNKASANKTALVGLVRQFGDNLASDGSTVRAYAAHSLRHTYCSFEGAVLAYEALVSAYESEEDDFVLIVISEALVQIGPEPEVVSK